MRPSIIRSYCSFSISSQTCRSFSSSRGNSRLPLAHQVWTGSASQNASSQSARNPIIFMHGLFGSKQNNRGMSKALASGLNTDVYTIDLRNHGESPHHEEHNYTAMASDVEHFIHENGLEKPVLLGHSMGAKTAMTVALRQPSLLAGLISVDNVPVRVPLSKDFAKYIQGMNEVEKAKVTKQKEADDILQRYEDSLPIRQFLLTNLIRSKDDNTLKFRIPLHVLRDRLEHMADFPFVPEQHAVKFEGPALFVRGTQSPYVPDSSLEVVKSFFPAFELEDIDAGHWVISENPEAFKNAVVDFFRTLPKDSGP